jgi:hypothetical protein
VEERFMAIQLFALIAVLGTGVVYGTDVFCAMVQRPALARVDDRALLVVMGNIHRYGDRRMPVPGVVGMIAAAISTALAAASGRWAQAGTAGIALGLLVVWLVIYLRVSAPINRQLTEPRPINPVSRWRPAPCRRIGTPSSPSGRSYKVWRSRHCV